MKKPSVSLTGGINTNQVFYTASGMEQRRNRPYTYFINGSLSLNIMQEFHAPVSFTYSNQRLSYEQPFNQQPFNQFGMSPYYKWVKGHFGWRNISYSPFTLNGHIFLGGALEISPDNGFRLGIMHGRLNKAVEIDTTLSQVEPAYLRTGSGFKVGYEKGSDRIFLFGFYGKDDVSSLDIPPDSFSVYPEENFVWSVIASKKFTEKLGVEIEYAQSVLTRDIRNPSDDEIYLVTSVGFVDQNTSTTQYEAIKAGISYAFDVLTIGANYSRIDPGYTTHGAYFFNNDLEDISFQMETNLFNNKISLAYAGGVQRDNLDDSKITTMNRYVNSLTVGYNSGNKTNLVFTYSNFQTVTNIRDVVNDLNQVVPVQNLDTLNYTQVAQTLNAQFSYQVKSSEEVKKVFNMQGSLQRATEDQGNLIESDGSTFVNANAGYVINQVKGGSTLSFNANANTSFSSGQNILFYGPSASYNRSLWDKKLRLGGTLTWNQTLLEQKSSGSVLNARITGGLTLKKKHSINLSSVLLNKTTNSALKNRFTEYTTSLSYSYRF